MNKKIAYILIRQRNEYPWAAVAKGLSRQGYDIHYGYPPRPDPDALVVTWNHYGAKGRVADKHRELGGRHIVFENGYIRETGAGETLYSVAENGFNGTGEHLIHMPDGRLEALGIEIERKKTTNGHILICGQRGGNYSPLSMPLDWPMRIVREIRAQSDAPIHYRPHPARVRESLCEELALCGVRILSPGIPLMDHLHNCQHVCVYTSSAGVEAYRRGYRVAVSGPNHILRYGTMYSRSTFFKRLAGELWTADEIGSGEAFDAIFKDHESRSGGEVSRARAPVPPNVAPPLSATR